MSREIIKACEFSCDEAVLAKMRCDNAQDYGKTLLNAMAALGKYKENLGAVTLSENKQLLKERLGAIMKFKKKSTAIRFLTGVLTLCVMFGAAFVGVYPVAAAVDRTTSKLQVTVDKKTAQRKTDTSSKDYAAQAERYYEAGSLPLFQTVFPGWTEKNSLHGWKKFTPMGISRSSLSQYVGLIQILLCLPTSLKRFMRTPILRFSLHWRTVWTKRNWSFG